MKVDFVNPFVKATFDVIHSELSKKIKKGDLSLTSSSLTTNEVTVMIGVVGQIQGVVLYGMSERTAKTVVATMTGMSVPVMDRMVESAIAELGNVITGRAAVELESAGYSCRLTPPTVIVGRGAIISTVSIQCLNIPIDVADHGELTLSVALREAIVPS